MTASINESLLPCPFCGLSDAHLTSGGPGNHFVRCDHCLASTDDGSKERAIAAWNRRQLPAGVEVKPLGWENAIHGGWVALGAAGLYHVHVGFNDGKPFWFFANPFDHEPNEFASPDEAKAAAQADYERRVLSSLSVKEPEGVEPVAWQCFDCVMEQWSVIDDAELAAARSRRDGEWIVCPLYVSPPTKAVTITDEMAERIESELPNLFWEANERGQLGTLRIRAHQSGLGEIIARNVSMEHGKLIVSALTAALSSEAHNDHA